MKKYKDNGVYDFSDYAEEITGDALFKINGGAEVENSHEGVAGAKPGDTITRKNGDVIVLKQADIDYANAQLENNGNDGTGNTNGNSGTGNNSNSGSNNTSNSSSTNNFSSGANNTGTSNTSTSESTPEVSEEIKQNSDAYANYMSMQGRAKDEGEPDRYKGYNVLGKEIISTFNDYSIEKKVGTITDLAMGFGMVEDLGLYASVIKTSYIVKDSKLTLLNSANFSKRYSPDNFSYQYGGEITLLINNIEVETQKLTDDGSAKIFEPDFPPIGDCYFNTYIPKGSNVKIKYNVDLCVNNAYVGGTYVTKDLF